jgi:hypothetical protein
MEECRVRYGKQPNNLSTKCGVWAHAGIKFDPWLFSIGVFCLHGGHTLAFKSLNAIVREVAVKCITRILSDRRSEHCGQPVGRKVGFGKYR